MFLRTDQGKINDIFFYVGAGTYRIINICMWQSWDAYTIIKTITIVSTSSSYLNNNNKIDWLAIETHNIRTRHSIILSIIIIIIII